MSPKLTDVSANFKDVLELGATACLARWRATVRDLTGRLDRVLHGGWLS